MTKTTSNEAPFTESVPVLGKRLLGLGRAASYEAAKTGVIPAIKVGRKLRGLSRVLEQRLTRDPQDAAGDFKNSGICPKPPRAGWRGWEMKGPVKSSPSPQAKHRGLEPMEYQNGNGHAIRMAMTGASLAHRLRRMTAAQRACSAADVDDGKVALVDLTAKSIAALHQVSLPYMQAAKKLSPAERDQVRRGERPLVPARPRAAPEAAPFDWLDDAAFIEVIRQIGVDRTLDAAIRRV